MRKALTNLILVFGMCSLVLALATPGLAQGRYRGRAYTKADVDRIIKRVEERADAFVRLFDNALDRSALNGTDFVGPARDRGLAAAAPAPLLDATGATGSRHLAARLVRDRGRSRRPRRGRDHRQRDERPGPAGRLYRGRHRRPRHRAPRRRLAGPRPDADRGSGSSPCPSRPSRRS